jgi:putative ABC transport system permease protein
MWPQLAATVLVMSVGIASLTMSLSTLSSLQAARQAYYDRYRFPHVWAHLKRAPLSLARRIAELPGVARAQARIVVDVNLDVPGLPEPAVGRIISVPDAPPYGLCELHVRQGRLPHPGAPEVAASEAFTEANRLGPGATLSAIINGRLERLTIVGVVISPEYIYQVRPGEMIPDDRRYAILWMPERQLAPAFDMDGAFNDVIVALTPGASEADVIARLDRLTAEYGGQGAHGRRDQTSYRYLSDEFDQIRGMASIPPALFLSAAAFILHIVFSRLIRTQREQIAALKAFGYGRASIAMHYLLMALVVALLGAAVGVAAGWRLGLLVTEMYGRFFRFPAFDFHLDPRAILIAITVGTAAAVAGTLASVRRAAALPPAQAMRPESPPDYRGSLLQRLGLVRVLGPHERMIVRHLERQPGRALLSCLGISIATAVLIVGSFVHGAVNHLVEFMFFGTQRQDMTVTFVEPASPGTLDEIASLPGVLACEPYRAVPARLRAGSISRLQAIMGLPARPQLNRVLDEQEAPAGVPPEGILVSDLLAEALGVRAGDRVHVELLEGGRPEVDVRVTAIVRTYVGTSAFMEIGSLNRLMREGAVTSGAFLAVDERVADPLYARLKESPRVASVTIKRAALDAFRSTMAENILRMRFYNLLFAGILAFGVVYNSARVSLAERGHELATLRVLGFTRGQVSTVLLGELAVLTAAAIPLGLVLGRALAGLVTAALEGESVRIPVVILPGTYAFASLFIAAATLASGLVVRRHVDRLDLVEVLKTKG